jgi:hypothetical protein
MHDTPIQWHELDKREKGHDMAIGIVRTGWQGTTGGPGLTQMAFLSDIGGAGDWDAPDAQAAVNAVRAFWAGINGYIPNEITLTVSPVVDVYDIQGGQLIASWQATTAPTAVVGLDSGVYSMASGVKVQWNTPNIANGRRVRGATFIVPAGTTAFTNSGLVASAARTAINAAGATLITSANTNLHPFVVWSRPETLTSNDGAWSAISAGETIEKGAILRGRRD